MNKFCLLFLLACLMSSGTSERDAQKALSAMGFTEIKTTGYKPFSCGKNDFFHTGFKAKNPLGQTVTGTVCSGLLIKDSTVRF